MRFVITLVRTGRRKCPAPDAPTAVRMAIFGCSASSAAASLNFSNIHLFICKMSQYSNIAKRLT